MKVIQGKNATMTLDESDDDYHASQGISASGMKLFSQGAIKYWAQKIVPDPDLEDVDEKEKSNFAIGKAGHCRVLEPERFASTYVQMERGAKRAGKAWADFQTEHIGKKILTHEQYRIATRCAESILSHESAAAIALRLGIAECSFRWMDKATGMFCKSRPDYHVAPCEECPNGLLFDLKFEESSDKDKFQKSSYEYGYHIQAAWNQNALMEFYGTTEMAPFVFIVVEKHYPWVTVAYETPEESISVGQRIIEKNMIEYAKCMETGVWAPKYNTMQTVELPRWAKERYDV